MNNPALHEHGVCIAAIHWGRVLRPGMLCEILCPRWRTVFVAGITCCNVRLTDQIHSMREETILKPITIQKIDLFPVAMPLVERLGTSFGKEPFKTAILVRLETSDGVIGWGETSAEINPGYSYETMSTAYHVVGQFLLPLLQGKTVNHPTDAPKLMAPVRGHPLAKHGLEAAIWDAFAKTNDMHIADLFASALPEINGEHHEPTRLCAGWCEHWDSG